MECASRRDDARLVLGWPPDCTSDGFADPMLAASSTLFVLLALAGPATEQEAPAVQLGLFLTGAPVGSINVQGDPNPGDWSPVGVGLDAEGLLRAGPHLRVGLGVRYQLAYEGQGYDGGLYFGQLWYVPLLIGGTIPFGDGSELEVVAGVGIARADVDSPLSGSSVRGTGPYAELGVTYWIPVGRLLAASFGAAFRVATLGVDDKTVHVSKVVSSAFPLRAGLRWSF
jgi:hypothetical protein